MRYPDRFTFEVTADDIAQGKPTKCAECPVARAVARCFPERKIHVGLMLLKINQAVYYLSRDATDFIESFDDGMEVVPCRLTVEKCSPL